MRQDLFFEQKHNATRTSSGDDKQERTEESNVWYLRLKASKCKEVADRLAKLVLFHIIYFLYQNMFT